MLCDFAFLAIVLCIGTPLFGPLHMTLPQLGMILLYSAFVITAFCSIYTFVAMLFRDVTISTTVCMLLFVAMFILQGSLSYILSTAEPIRHTYTDEYGNETVISEEENPNYPGDTIYSIAKTFYLLLPQGPAYELQSEDAEFLYQIPVYSVICTALVTSLGLYLFSRRELK